MHNSLFGVASYAAELSVFATRERSILTQHAQYCLINFNITTVFIFLVKLKLKALCYAAVAKSYDLVTYPYHGFKLRML